MTISRNPDANVPLGTIADYEGQPRTPLRDFDFLVIPGMTLTPAGVRDLEKRIADYWNALARYRLRELDFDALGIDLDEARDDLGYTLGLADPGEPGNLELVDWVAAGSWLEEIRRSGTYGYKKLRELAALLMADEVPQAADHG